MEKIPIIRLILASTTTGLIGRNNSLPWRLRSDVLRFKILTWDQVVIMGRKTYETIPSKFRPLPHRLNIVLSRDQTYDSSGVWIAHSVQEAIGLASVTDQGIFIAGGADIYHLFLPFTQDILWTEVIAPQTSLAYQEGDTFFPIREILSGGWEKDHEENIPVGEGDDYPSVFQIYRRKEVVTV